MENEEDELFWDGLKDDLDAIGGGKKKVKPEDESLSIEQLVSQIETLIKNEPELMKSLSLIIFKFGILSTENKTLHHINQRIRNLIKNGIE